MIRLRRVRGTSMHPTLEPGTIVAVSSRMPEVGEIAIAMKNGREIIKRVKRIDEKGCYLVGDNNQESTDSRHYGNIAKSDILGTIMITLPKAVSPPKLVKPYGLWLGRFAALVLIVMSLVHLFRIDTFVPILDGILPGGNVVAGFIAVLIITSEVFAIPFALRMKLSPLAHLKSGALLALTPLWWLLISIWTLGIADNTGQLGEFVAVESTLWVLLLNLAWVTFSYYTLYTLGYNRLKLSSLLKK